MDAQEIDAKTTKYPLGGKVAEGKTKSVYGVKNQPDLAIIIDKNDITAGNGKKHDIIEGKANWATTTTCNVFALLKRENVPVAYVEQDSPNSFIARKCNMLLYEVVVRREAHGSMLKREPLLEPGHRFEKLLVEFYLKTSNRSWADKPLVCDDPLMNINWEDGTVYLYDPSKPFRSIDAFAFFSLKEIIKHDETAETFDQMSEIAAMTFGILEEAWATQNRKLVDFKVEFGFDFKGRLLLADVIDNDSWRVLGQDGSYMDKQVYRDGGELSLVAAKYAHVAELTGRF